MIDKRGIMGKNLLITFGLAIVLFIYGYLASSVGHDHSQHDEKVEQSHNEHDHNH